MFNNILLSDIKFAIPKADSNSMIPVHKYVLAISSPVFFTMFYGDLAETRDTINITDCDSDVFLRFLRFIYCEEANFEDTMCAVDVWHLADKYDVPSLAKECLEYLDGNMDPLDAFDLLKYARRFNNEIFEKTCWEVIDYNAEAIVADESFLDVQHAFLLSFVKRSSARIKELSLFQALDRWATKKCEDASTNGDGEHKRQFLGEDIIKQFRFSLMSPEEFSHEVEPSGVLQPNEILDVFKQFSSVSIPGGFKFSTSPRRSSYEAMTLSCDLGNIKNGSFMTHASRKTGVLTFAVTKDVLLSGVKIVTDKGREYCRVSLAIAHGDKEVRRIKDHNFICNYYNYGSTDSYGEIDVVFNRPFALGKNTCYTIKTNTDTTNNLDSGFVYQTSGFSNSGFSISSSIIGPTLFGSTPSLDTNKSNNANPIISFSNFGNCDKTCPEHSAVGGEITKLVFVRDNEPTDVPRWL